MLIAIPSGELSIDAPLHSRLRSCPAFVVVDPDDLESFEAIENTAVAGRPDSEMEVAREIVSRSCDAVVVGEIGPDAWRYFNDQGVDIRRAESGTVRMTATRFARAELPQALAPSGSLRTDDDGVVRPPSHADKVQSPLETGSAGGEGRGFGAAPLNEAAPIRQGDEPDPERDKARPLNRQDIEET